MEQRGLHAVPLVIRGLTGVDGWWGGPLLGVGLQRMPGFFFPCSPLPMKILENSTFPSAKHVDTVTPGKVGVNANGKATGREEKVVVKGVKVP